MFELNGKNNTAKVFTDNCDNETISQLMNLLNQESMKDSQIRIMPDCHAGKGCVIGTTMTITDKVIPNLVGVDIGCGMKVVALKDKSIDYAKLDDAIYRCVPSGFSIHEKSNPCCHTLLNEIIAPINIDNAEKSLGTLGGGNHFIEVDKDEDDNLYLVIHTGSRHLGMEVCTYYQELAYETLNKAKNAIKTSEIIARLKIGIIPLRMGQAE